MNPPEEFFFFSSAYLKLILKSKSATIIYDVPNSAIAKNVHFVITRGFQYPTYIITSPPSYSANGCHLFLTISANSFLYLSEYAFLDLSLSGCLESVIQFF